MKWVMKLLAKKNIVMWTVPKYLRCLSKDASVLIESIKYENGTAIELTLKVEKTVLYVHLTCEAQGRFEDNSFAMAAGSSKVSEIMGVW
mmetsp:Transcript_2084/g.3108  ORF Transcript_2084/g.3108 Transcript_2084/m.3108 type:complete len:89 (+) Transcript_2084:495-761(+)